MTHNEKVLALLSDGQPHTHHEIYALYVVGHSRIADLRKRGHFIESWRDGDDYLYQLCSGEPSVASPQVPVSPRHQDAAGVPLSASSEQLHLTLTAKQVAPIRKAMKSSRLTREQVRDYVRSEHA